MALRNGKAARGASGALWAKRFLGSSSLTAVALLALASPARAEDVYWDANGAAVGSGGTGNWDLTSSLWSRSNSDVLGPFVPWTNNPADPNNAIFGVSAPGVTTTVGTITLMQPITAHNLTFQTVHGWVLNGSTLTLGGVNPTITTVGSTTLNSVIAGTAGLIKAGTSTLTLNGVNSFSGGIVINAGTLNAATDAALGAAGNNITTAAGVTTGFSLTSGSTSRSITIGTGGTLNLGGTGGGSALVTGTGNVNVATGVTMNNDANNYDGVTRFSACNGVCSTAFTSIGNLGEASSLGAPTTVTNGTIIWNQSSQYTDNLLYLGDGDDSNRNWTFNANSTGTFINQGSGTLNLTGNFTINGFARFVAQTADFNLSGVISGGGVAFSAGAGRQVTVSGLNTYTGTSTLQTGLINVGTVANGGVASALGAGTQININAGILNYIGTGGSSDRTFLSEGSVGIRNSGTGALTFGGPLSFQAGGAADTLTFGGNYAGVNEFAGVITGTGALGSTGSSIWRLSGANTRTGAITMDGGTLQAGSASAFGNVTGVTVNGGTLDLNGYDLIVPQLSGTGGSVALNGLATLTVSGLTPANNTTYGGGITGDGSLLKRGTSTLTLTGQSSYSGATTVQGGTLALDFSPAAAPADNILSAASTLTMAGGTLSITGAAGEVNSQSFNGLNVTAGTNRIVVASGAGGTMNVNLGTLANSGGLMDFTLPTTGTITAANPDGALGWATINGRDYAQVSGGVIGAFTAYVNKDDASAWLSGDVVSDAGGAANTAYSGTVSGSQQLVGLQYTAAQNSVVTIGAGNTLGIDGTIIVSNTTGATSKEFTGGMLTGAVGGGTLGFQHNGTGNFLVSSQIVDNGADAVGVSKAGVGRVTLNNVNNSYTGATTLSGGTLTVASIGNGGAASAIGASSADAANLVLESGTLSYSGGTATTDRGFTLVNGGPSRIFEVTNGAANLTFTGLVTSPDDAGFIKSGGGTLTLANGANDYSGVTRVENGVLAAAVLADGGQASSIGQSGSDAANLVLLNGGTLRYTGGTAGTDRGITLENAAGRIDVSAAATDLTVGGSIVGAGRLEKYGDGTLVLTGANSYTGITVVNAGTLRAGAALVTGATTGVFGSTTSVMTVNAGGTLDLADNSNQIGALNGGGNVVLGALAGTTLTIGGSNSGDPGFTGSISGAGNVIHTTGAQVMTGCNNSYAGSTSLIGNGSLSTDCIRNGGLASGIGASGSDSANLVLQTGGILNYTAVAANQTSDRGFTLASGNGIIQVNDAATSLTFTGAAVGTGALIKRGAGTLILSGDNSYTGTTGIDAGRLVAGSAGAFDQGAGVLALANVAGAIFDLNGFDASFLQLQGGGANGGTVDLGAGNATLTLSNNGNNSYGGTIIGTGNLVKAGAATQSLTGCASTYGGVTAIRAGVLQISCLANGGAASSIGAASNDAANLLLDGGTLRYMGTGESSDRLFTLGASTTSALEASGTGAIAFTNTGPIGFSSPNTAQRVTLGGTSTADNSLAALITDNGTGRTAISKTGAGTWILTNQANSYTGTTTVSGGVLGVDKIANGGVASSIGQSASAAANLVIGTGATLRYTGSGDATDRLFTLGVGTTALESVGTGAVVFSNTGAVSYSGSGARVISLGGTNAGNNIMGGTIGNQGANVTSLAKNGSGTWILTGNNSFSGSTVINDGNLVIGNGGTSGNAGTGNVNVTQATSTLSFNRSDTFNFTGTISGPGAIAQIGTGTTVLTAVNSIGAARVDRGTLQVNGALQTAAFAMNGTGALTVNGTVEGATPGVASAFTGDAGASAITVNAGGTLRATGDLGDGADMLVLAGVIDTGGAALNLGAGDDGLTLNDGGTISGTVDAGAGTDTLVVNNVAARTIDAAQVTGFEALGKQGTGTLTLTGDHGYSAGTTISAGILSVGNGSTTGTLSGNVVNNAALQFNRLDTSLFAGNISGTGSLTKLGLGALFLTGDATHGGGTTILGGTLSIGNGGTSGSISGDIVNNASLNFNRSGNYTYAGSISGTGAVTTRSGIVNLTGNSNWSGATNVVDDSHLRIASGNTVSSGGSLIVNRGTLTVSGAGSTFQAGSANAVSPSGTAVINVDNGGTLRTTVGGLAIRGSGTPSQARLAISGAGSLVDVAGALSVATGTTNTADITISAGGTLRSSGDNLIGSTAGNTAGPNFTITGAGSNWTSSGNLVMRDGSFSLLAGGAASFGAAQIGTANGDATALVSGAGSLLTTTQDLSVGTLAGGRGVLTLANGGRVSVGGVLAIGSVDAGASGILNIGGTVGSAAVAAGVVDAASLTFGPGAGTLNFNHTEADYGFASAMSGNGTINQVAGVTRLTGNSGAFTGQTAISGGTLLVNGTLGSAASITNVLAGGRLGGSGTIGGNVVVANGGTLAPGNSPGTLTINGNLALNSGSLLAFEFGRANAPGDPLNDVVNVGGNLTLDGTLNVAASAGGSFDIGLYRIFNYAGALTDNGLALGTVPGGIDVNDLSVQTSIAGQVNLINANGVTLNFWDGAAGPKFNGAVDGGSGLWQNGTGNDNWTDSTGAVNAPFTDSAVAIFSAAPGTVTVDGGLGAVSAGGMQFASDGYVVTGDGVTLANPQSVIRVGDGTAAGAAYGATIDSALGGAGVQLVKTDLGTLTLGGVNSYTGGTLVNGGTLRISADANLGDVAGGLTLDGGTFNSSASFSSGRAVTLTGSGIFQTDAATALTLDGVISGGGLIKQGAGALVLTAANLYAGGTTVGAGTLQIGAGGTTGSLVGDVLNNGVLAFDRSDISSFGGVISGSGRVDQAGSGTTVLTAANLYTGGTTIGAGTLQIGAGGTSGSIVGDVLNNGTLAFDRSDEVIFGGLISGSGGVDQIGAGTTILTGGNSYGGTTRVVAGTLLINGDQSAATGLTNVAAGATLGGTGIVGGDVTTANGARLKPGDATGPGTLTVNGNLGLTSGTTLAYDFGQSNVVGGPLNDLLQVGGDLNLDGVIDVNVSAGGSFDVGVYRVISYGGSLTNNGLDLGVLPVGTLALVQTSIAGQVNLVNATGATLNFWDGALGPKADGIVDGGDGVWQNGTGNNNWTEISGSINAAFTDDAFAIFSAAPGAVTVDGSLGAVTASGMQFASGGYVIGGDGIALSGPQSVVRVGDGTAAGLGFTATIDSVLTGNTRLVKTDLGTLVLNGTNSYSGGTRVNAGTLRISRDANLGDATGGIAFDGGTLHGTASITSARNVEMIGMGTILTDAGTTLVLNGSVTGSGDLVKDGAGNLALNDTSDYTGLTIVRAGGLFVNGDQSAATGLVDVAAGAVLGGHGIIGGDVAVADGGRLAPGNSPGTLTINGNLALNSGSLLAFEFGQANVAGGALNDLVNVGGDLTLDGTIDVAVSAGGSFGGGVYRVFNYGGVLTDNGLTMGTMPVGSAVAVQTAIAGQVNLVNTAGLDLSFWDGQAGPKNDGVIEGGNGIWRVAGGNNNWTESAGQVNADYAQNSFAIFAGAPGLVSVDNIGGAVQSAGMQFAVDGYMLAGDALTLTGPQATIRVGDGTAASAGHVATIVNALTGAATLVKTDGGTLVLGGVNSYTGGTAIDGGTVRISADANLGDAAGALSFNGGALNTTLDLNSARAVNLVGTGTLLTDAGAVLGLTGALAGNGALVKDGAGTLILNGTGGHGGGTSLLAGALLVNGDYGAATGLMTVAAGASLGGGGTIGGDVALADGAILTPGAGGAGTLTIGGDLALSAGTRLAYEFGQANVAGGALNDLVNVDGDLTLDGILDVTVPAGGAFDAGVYHVFNYGGALTNNGLTLGAMPVGDVTVQTSISGQVNLVNAAGLMLNFWDGAAGPRNNGVVNGGNGLWQNGGGNDNWTDASGLVNAAYQDGGFAIFAGAGGAVTVDNSLGQVTASGMQFAANGYTIGGGVLELSGPASTIRVGDGSTAGAAFTATVGAVLAGDTRLVKTDAGTLVLGGVNSYTGGTLINGGTLQIAADANLGAASGAVALDGGTLATSASLSSTRDILLSGNGTIATMTGTSFTYGGLFSGTGELTKAGAGTLIVSGDSGGYTALTTVAAGTLALNGALGGTVDVQSGARLEGSGRAGALINRAGGVVAAGNGIGSFTVGGDYQGMGGVLEIEAELGGDASAADRLVVNGATSGTTQVQVLNRGGLGAQTVEGIKIVDVAGASSGTFALNGDYVFAGQQAVIAGAYGYRLYQGGVSTPTDGDWYLRSALIDDAGEPQGPLYQPGVPIYESYGQTLLALNGLSTMQERVGNRQWAQSPSGVPTGIWGRMESSRLRPGARLSTSGADADIDSWKAQIGVDHMIGEGTDSALVAGLTAHYGEADASVRSVFGSGTIDTKGYGVGATLSWFGPDGFYADGQAQLSWFDSRLKSVTLGTLADGNDGKGQAVSLELGKTSVVGRGLTLTPQIQMAYQNVSFDAFTDPFDARISSGEGDSLKTRWGISIDHRKSWEAGGVTRNSHVYGLVNLSYEWLDGTRVDVSGTGIAKADERLWGEVALGGTLGLTDRITLYAQASGSASLREFGDSYKLKGVAGVRWAF
ncbi:outer membrane autotransporter barrel domain protein [Sphingobium chlorophenolicum L-1]|uniref:Outer membrane autotransporter barrel domain protein n=1 Tax=Sphingobium chlorophenolicum L-1 TaxID=690566 RepID=F6F2E3_SPHCR|nr:autotransporter-associated beta strand repeat-containing protein [Sphingobium chlorophenolicum]AEG50605.1 outer membrane autotransporter barrel domain protein [Sphingobium chlorophenolicum L-1]